MTCALQRASNVPRGREDPEQQAPDPHHVPLCIGSEAGPYLRLIDFVYHSTLGLRVINKKRRFTLETRTSDRLARKPTLVVCGSV